MSFKLRQRIVREALGFLEEVAQDNVSGIDGAPQPIVFILVGDPNLDKDSAEEAVQALQPADPQWDAVWQVHTTTGRQSGDIIFLKGATGEPFDLPFPPDLRTQGWRT